jgi:hypothetical protein
MRPSATVKDVTWSKKGLDLWWRLGTAKTYERLREDMGAFNLDCTRNAC